jgi:hypothetical protein
MPDTADGPRLTQSNCVLFSEPPVSFVWRDGEIGYGHCERGLWLR